MSSVFDDPSLGLPDIEPEPEEPRKRSKKRELKLTSLELREGQSKAMAMVERAFNTLEDAMLNADYATSVKAAQIILDRTGFGPKTTVDMNTTHLDLTELTMEQLAERAMNLAQSIAAKDSKTIDVTPTTVQ